MKTDLIHDKIRVFNTLIVGIETALEQKSSRLFVKGMSVLGNKLDVVAERSEWLTVLQKAQSFFETVEDYEKCAKCKNLADYIKNNNLDTDVDETEENSNSAEN